MISQRWLPLLRLAWALAVGLPLAITLANLAVYYSLLLHPCADCLVKPTQAQALRSAGWSLPLWAALNVGSAALLTLAYVGVGLLVFWRRRSDPRLLFMSAVITVIGAGSGFRTAVQGFRPEWALASQSITFVLTTSLILLFFILPNGRIAPRWTVWPMLYLVTLNVGNLFFPASPILAWGKWPLPAEIAVFWLPLLASLIAVPVYRYRYVLSSAERQQMKWVLAGLVLFIAALALIVAYGFTCQSARGAVPECIVPDSATDLLSVVIPISIGIAILRSRLFDIDILIRRTLIYAVLTGLLALAYFGSVVLLQNIFAALTGQSQSTLVTVLSTLVIAALSVPLRRRVQSVIDRRLYRRKYDAARTLAAFGASVRDEVELEALTEHLVGVVDDTLGPDQVSFWLRPMIGPASRGQRE